MVIWSQAVGFWASMVGLKLDRSTCGQWRSHELMPVCVAERYMGPEALGKKDNKAQEGKGDGDGDTPGTHKQAAGCQVLTSVVQHNALLLCRGPSGACLLLPVWRTRHISEPQLLQLVQSAGHLTGG